MTQFIEEDVIEVIETGLDDCGSVSVSVTEIESGVYRFDVEEFERFDNFKSWFRRYLDWIRKHVDVTLESHEIDEDWNRYMAEIVVSLNSDTVYYREHDGHTVEVKHTDGCVRTVVSTEDSDIEIQGGDIRELRHSINKACDAVISEQQSQLSDFKGGAA